MSKGENIFKRKDGRWEARYVKGYDYTGKIRYGYCYGKSYKEAKEKVMKHKAAILNGTPILSSRSRQNFSYYCDQWLRINRKRIKESTYNKYESILNKYIKKNLGHLDPIHLNQVLVEEFSSQLLDQAHLSCKTVKDILILLQSILKFTSKQLPGCIQSIELVYPKETKKEMRVLSVEEQTRLISYLNKEMDQYKFGILLALCTGMRIGELCALKWKDICFDTKIIKITSTVQRLKDDNASSSSKTKLVISSPKSNNSTRQIPMTESINTLCKKMKPLGQDTYVLSGTYHLVEPRALQYHFKKATQECHIENVHFHSLRHTFATRCVEAGFEIKSLSEILGHSSTSITLNRYVHSSMELKRINMEKLNSVLF